MDGTIVEYALLGLCILFLYGTMVVFTAIWFANTESWPFRCIKPKLLQQFLVLLTLALAPLTFVLAIVLGFLYAMLIGAIEVMRIIVDSIK